MKTILRMDAVNVQLKWMFFTLMFTSIFSMQLKLGNESVDSKNVLELQGSFKVDLDEFIASLVCLKHFCCDLHTFVAILQNFSQKCDGNIADVSKTHVFQLQLCL